jgi:glycyl-tRNA synthetase
MTVDLKDIMALCKRRGFVFQASEIYGGINGFWDYGPLGVELKNNIRDAWWRSMVIAPPIGPDGMPVSIVGLDSAIIQNAKVWEASGHVGGFSDPMVDCKETKQRYRADHIFLLEIPGSNTVNIEGKPVKAFAFVQGTSNKEIEKRLKEFRVPYKLLSTDGSIESNLLFTGFENVPADQVVGPDASKAGTLFIKHDKLGDFSREHLIGPPNATKPNTLTEEKEFNLMFESSAGAVKDEASKVYLRPETAQGIFLNFKNVVDSSRVRVPFGIAQVGKSFRNEVTPRNFIFRSREFEQMEMEFFCHPDEAKMWFDFWVAERKKWWLNLGVPEDLIYMHTIDIADVAHYAKKGHGNVDIEFKYPFTDPNYGELEGIAHRVDFDLSAHQEHSGQKLEYMDPEDTTKRFIPHVIEPAAGLTRGVLALLCAAYKIDENRPSGMYLDFHPSIAPKKAAILPLTAKGEHPEIATKLYLELRKEYNVDLDIKQNIGKRYARQDEIGTPYCFTIDDTTVSEGTVTVRDRNTTQQERIPLTSVKAFLDQKIKGE